jgi:hypothetical protein
MKALRRLLLVVVAAALPLVTIAQDAAPKPPPLTFYGNLYLGMFFDGGSFNAQDAAWRGLQTNNGGSFSMTARQSRLGVKANLGNDNLLGATLTGNLEFDFVGGYSAAGSANNYKPVPRLRIASATASWGDFSVLIGQDWPIILNLNGESVVYLANPLFGDSGNLYERAPQVRLSWGTNFGDFGVGIQAAMLTPADGTGTGADNGNANFSRSPRFEGRAQVSLKGDVGGTVGVAVDSEKRRYNYNAAAGTKLDETSTLIGIDADLSLTKFAQVKGEYYTSTGAEDQFAGILSPSTVFVNAATGAVAVKSTGYWGQLILKPVPEFWVTGGMGQEKLDKPSLIESLNNAAIGAGTRTKNETTSVGLILNAAKNWRMGLEYTSTKSTYGNLANETSVKIQQIALASQLKF